MEDKVSPHEADGDLDLCKGLLLQARTRIALAGYYGATVGKGE